MVADELRRPKGGLAEPGFFHQGLALELVHPLVVADLPKKVRE
jgi:hypothetical protein